jgi:hypothetical protein
MTHADVLRDAGRTLLLGMSGWALGAAVIGRFATGSLIPDLDLVYLAVVLWVAVPVLAIAALRLLHDGRLRRSDAGSRTSLVWGVIALATCVALVDTTRPVTQQWSTMQVWLALGFITPFGVAVSAGPRLLRLKGWSGAARGVSWRFRLTLVGAALGVFVVALAAGDALVGSGAIAGFACDPSVPMDLCAAIQPTLPVIGVAGWAVFGGLVLAALVAFAFDLGAVAAGLIGTLYLAVAFWARYPWNAMLDGSLTVSAPLAMLALHVVAAGALIVAVALIQVFREPGGSETERELTEWLRAESFLPEARPAPADGKATS